MNRFQIFGLIYISKNMIIGQENVVNKIRTKQLQLVVISNVASDNTKKMIRDKCKYYEVELIEIEDNGAIEKSVGKKNLKVLAITSSGFAKKIRNEFKGD